MQSFFVPQTQTNSKLPQFSQKMIDSKTIGVELWKLSNFLQHWQKLSQISKQESSQATGAARDSNQSIKAVSNLQKFEMMSADPMLSFIVYGFSSAASVKHLNLNKYAQSEDLRVRLLVMNLRRILELLREVFFPKGDQFLVANLDNLIALVESTLETRFGTLNSDDQEVEIFIQDKVESEDFEMVVQSFLLNARSMTTLVAFAFYNQIKILKELNHIQNFKNLKDLQIQQLSSSFLLKYIMRQL